MMTGQERITRALSFNRPDRIPLGVMPPDFPTDLLNVGATADPDRPPTILNDTHWIDEFGCTWQKLHGDKTKGQVTDHPLTDYAMLPSYPFPNYSNPNRYAKARAAILANQQQRYVLAHVPLSLIHRLEYLRGHLPAWTDPYEHPTELRQLLHRLADLAIAAIDNFARIGAHGIYSCDDWGLQDRPLLSPEMFAEFWAPVYQRVYQHAHRLGLHTFLHSCGYIADLLPHFIEAQLAVIQMDQQENMGIENLAQRFAGSICFWCPVDIQGTMITGSIAAVQASARQLMHAFGSRKGGFIAQWYAAPQAVGHCPEKINAMCREFVDYGATFYHPASTT